MTLILGRKQGMTQVFTEDGTQIGVTVVAAGPCVVTQVRFAVSTISTADWSKASWS